MIMFIRLHLNHELQEIKEKIHYFCTIACNQLCVKGLNMRTYLSYNRI